MKLLQLAEPYQAVNGRTDPVSADVDEIEGDIELFQGLAADQRLPWHAGEVVEGQVEVSEGDEAPHFAGGQRRDDVVLQQQDPQRPPARPPKHGPNGLEILLVERQLLQGRNHSIVVLGPLPYEIQRDVPEG